MGIERVEAVITCEGNLSDPEFPKKFGKFLSKLSTVICKENRKEKLKVLGVEPWNSVRVKFTLPKDAAVRLRQLAQAGDGVLKELGILSVQLEGDQVISLTLAGREPQDVVFKTPAPAAPLPSHSLSGNNGAFAVVQPQPGPSNGPLADTSLSHFDAKNVSDLLSQAVNLLSDGNLLGELGLPPVTFKTPAAPNVVASSSQPIQFTPPPKAGPSRTAFPFASMQQAMPGTSGIRNPPASAPPVTRYQLNVRTSTAPPPTTSQPTFLHPAAAGITKPLSRSYSNSFVGGPGPSSSSQPGPSGQHNSPVLANLLQNDLGPKRSDMVRRYPSVVDTRPRPVPPGQPPPRPSPLVPLRSPSLAPVPSAPFPRSELANPCSFVSKIDSDRPPDRNADQERVPELPSRPGPSAPPIAPERRPETKQISAIHLNGEPSHSLDDRLPLLALDSAEIEQELAALEKKPSPTFNPVRSASNPCEPLDMDGQPKSEELKKDEAGSTGIKLRLKLGRSEPTTPSYTVDIVKDEPRVPPLCISLKNRNITLLSPKKDEDSAKVKLKSEERKPKKRKVGSDSELELTVNCEVPGILKIKKPKLDESLTKKSIDKKRLKKIRDNDSAATEEGRVPPLDLSTVPDYPAKPCDPSAAPTSLPPCPDELEGLEGLANKAQHVRKEFLGTSLREGDHLSRIGDKLKPNDKLYKISVLNSATRTLSENECETIRNTSQIEAYQMDLQVKSDVVQSPVDSNSGNNQGEDSGIESMDALSEKSPNQGESPARLDLVDPNGPMTRTPDRKLSSPMHTSPKEDAFADLPSDLTLCSPQPFENSVTAVLTDELLSGRLTSENRESSMLPEEMLAVKLISEELEKLEEFSRTVIHKECHSVSERTEAQSEVALVVEKTECALEPSLPAAGQSDMESQLEVPLQHNTVSVQLQEVEAAQMQGNNSAGSVIAADAVPAETERTSSEIDTEHEFRTSEEHPSSATDKCEQQSVVAETLQAPEASENSEVSVDQGESVSKGEEPELSSNVTEVSRDLAEICAADDLPKSDLPPCEHTSTNESESLPISEPEKVQEPLPEVTVEPVQAVMSTIEKQPDVSVTSAPADMHELSESVSSSPVVEPNGAEKVDSSEPAVDEKPKQTALCLVVSESEELSHSSQPVSPKPQLDESSCKQSLSPPVPVAPAITPGSPKAILQGQRTFVLPPGKKMVPIKLVTLPKGVTPPTSLSGGPQFKVLVPMKSGTGVYYKSVVVSTASSDTVMAARVLSPAEPSQATVEPLQAGLQEMPGIESSQPSLKETDTLETNHSVNASMPTVKTGSELKEPALQEECRSHSPKPEPVLTTVSGEHLKETSPERKSISPERVNTSPSKQVDDLQVEHNYSCSSRSSEETTSTDPAETASTAVIPVVSEKSPRSALEETAAAIEVEKEPEDESSGESDVQISQLSTELSEEDISDASQDVVSEPLLEVGILEPSSDKNFISHASSHKAVSDEVSATEEKADSIEQQEESLEVEDTEPEKVIEENVAETHSEASVSNTSVSVENQEQDGTSIVKVEAGDETCAENELTPGEENLTQLANKKPEDNKSIDLTPIKSDDSTSPEMAMNMKGVDLSDANLAVSVNDETSSAVSETVYLSEDTKAVEQAPAESVKEPEKITEDQIISEKADIRSQSDVGKTVPDVKAAEEVIQTHADQLPKSEPTEVNTMEEKNLEVETNNSGDMEESSEVLETERPPKLDIDLPTVCVDEPVSELNGNPKQTKRIRCSKTPEVEDFKTPIEDFLLDIPEPVLRSTRSGTRLVSPDLSKLEAKLAQMKSSPSPGAESQQKRGVRRKREDSGSSLRSDDRNSNTPDSEVSGPSHSTRSNTPEIGRPGKRKCSENASELIKACMGVDDRRRSTLQGDVGEGEQKKRTASGENLKTQRNNDVSKMLEDVDEDSDSEKKGKPTAAGGANVTAKKARGTRPITSSANKTAASKIASSKDSENSPRKSRRGSTDSTASGGQPAATPNERRTRSTPMKSQNKPCGQSTPDTTLRKGTLSGVATAPRSTPKRRVK